MDSVMEKLIGTPTKKLKNLKKKKETNLAKARAIKVIEDEMDKRLSEYEDSNFHNWKRYMDYNKLRYEYDES